MLLGRRDEQELGRVGRAAGEHDQVGGEALELTAALDHHLGHRLPVGARLELDHLRVRQQLDVLVLERRPHAEHVRVRLAVHRAGEAVAVHAADARAVRQVRLVQADAARCVERVEAGRLEVVRELLDPRLVRDGRERIRRARVPLGRVLASRAVHLVVLLGQACSTARARRRRSARPARSRRGAAARRSPRAGAGRAPRRRAWSRRRRSSGSAAGTPCRARRTRCPRRRSGCRRRRPAPASSAARAAASRRARATGSACPMARGGVRASRLRPRCRR